MDYSLHDLSESLYFTLKSEWAYEESHNFQLLSEIPSSAVKFYLKNISLLSTEDRNKWVELHIKRFLRHLWPELAKEEVGDTRWILEYSQKYFSAISWERFGLAMLRGYAKSSENLEMTSWFPIEMQETILNTIPAKASQIRKRLHPIIKDELNLFPIKSSGGEWQYNEIKDEWPPKLLIDYAGMNAQVRYEVVHDIYPFKPPMKLFNYEKMLGIHSAAWDLIDEKKLPEYCLLLVRLIYKIESIISESINRVGKTEI